MKPRIALFIVIWITALSLQACGKISSPIPSSLSPTINTPVSQTGDLTITSLNAFLDPNGTYRIVGLVTNNSNTIISAIELSVEIKDEAGNSILRDENSGTISTAIFNPLLNTISPGESSPFIYYYDMTNGTPASYDVKITSKQIGNANRADLRWERVKMEDNGSGWIYLTGELVNNGNQWAHINGLAGAVMDDSNQLISTDWTSTFTTELAPSGDKGGRDSTPFEINFPSPGGSTQWKLFWDADATESVTDYPVVVQVSNLYFDQYGSVHVIGWLTNNSDQTLDSLVLAGINAGDGTVLDSSYAFTPIPMKPGTSVPFSLSAFENINNNSKQAALVITATAQADPWFTTPTLSEIVDLPTSGETVQKSGATWSINGNVPNTSGKDLSGATVVIMVMDTQNKLVAMEYSTISPVGESIVTGETLPYSVTVSLDATADATNFTTNTLVVGYVK
jgi:hypothetical protein